MHPSVKPWLIEARHALAYQAELGLSGVPGADGVLVAKAVAKGAAKGVQAAQAQTQAWAASADVSIDPDSERQEATLDSLRQALAGCQRCALAKGRHSIVFGVGNPQAELMFIGEGPGRDEDLQGEPFVGPAGMLLDRMIVAMGRRRSDVYIANIVKCRPPQNRDPEPSEVTACAPFLARQIALVAPKVIVALGRYAAQTLLQDKTPISRLRGQVRRYRGILTMPTFHPAYLLRNPADKRLVWHDLQAVMQMLQ